MSVKESVGQDSRLDERMMRRVVNVSLRQRRRAGLLPMVEYDTPVRSARQSDTQSAKPRRHTIRLHPLRNHLDCLTPLFLLLRIMFHLLYSDQGAAPSRSACVQVRRWNHALVLPDERAREPFASYATTITCSCISMSLANFCNRKYSPLPSSLVLDVRDNSLVSGGGGIGTGLVRRSCRTPKLSLGSILTVGERKVTGEGTSRRGSLQVQRRSMVAAPS